MFIDALRGTRKGIRSALFASSLVMYGVNPVGDIEPNVLVSKNEKVLTYVSKNGIKERYFFDNRYNLLRLEVERNSSILTSINFEFEKKKRKLYLQKVTIQSPSAGFRATHDIQWKESGGIKLPYKIIGGPTIDGKDYRDIVTIIPT